MNLPDIINVAIGLVVLFFLLSTLASLLVELVANLLRYREELLIVTVNRMLTGLEDRPWDYWRLFKDRMIDWVAQSVSSSAARRFILKFQPGPTALPKLADDPEGDARNQRVVDAFWAHAKIKAITEPGSDSPSHLEADTFANVLVDVAIPRESTGEPVASRVRLERRLSAADVRLPAHLVEAIHSLGLGRDMPLSAAGPEFWSAFKANLAVWFDEAMAETTRRYRRLTQMWLFWIGLIAAFVLNADSLRVLHVLSRDSDVREGVAAYADLVATEEKASDEDAQPAGKALTETRGEIAQNLRQLQRLEGLGFPLGWSGVPAIDYAGLVPADNPVIGVRARLKKLSGFLMTAFAVTLGAPFWYDLLRRLLSVRNKAGASAKEEGAEAGTPDVPAKAAAMSPETKASSPAAVPLEIGRDLAKPDTEFDPRKAYWLAEVSALAYLGPEEISRRLSAQWCFRPPVLSPVEGVDNSIADFWDVRLPDIDTQAFVASDDRVVVLAFRGTEPDRINDLLTDASIGKQPLPSGESAFPGLVHGGFANALAPIWESVAAALVRHGVADKQLYITGHSLGGALATLAAARLLVDARVGGGRRMQLYTYGCPLVGDAAFARAFDQKFGPRAYRVVHGGDVVTQVPPPSFGFHHVGEMVHLLKPSGVGRESSSVSRLLSLGIDACKDLKLAAREAVADHSLERYGARTRRWAETGVV